MKNIIPFPNKIIEKEGYFILNKSIKIKDFDLFPISLSFIKEYLNLELSDNGNIIFEQNSDLLDEEYNLDINSFNIKIEASTDKGAFYGIQTLRQLLPYILENNKEYDEIKIDNVFINDKPKMEYRGFMLDVSRHFFTKETILRQIDIMSMFKFNAFHFHISDDQGFRLDLPNYPKLKEISSIRKGSQVKGVIRHFEYDDIEVSGYYKVEEIKEILAFAKKRFIKVIPEFDCPGHTQSILAAYPEFLCDPNKKVEVCKSWGIIKNVLCLGKEGVIDFAYNITKEIAQLFEADTIHIGGDECPTDHYKKCPDCRRLMKEKGIKNVKKLQGTFTEELSNKLINDGLKVRVWNEAISDNSSKDVEIQLWRLIKNNKTVIKKIKSGNKVIASPFMAYYLDYVYNWFSLETTYNYDQYFTKMIGNEYKDNIIGVECPLWAEWIRTQDKIDFMMFPRSLAVLESAWTLDENKNYQDFLNRLDEINLRLDELKVKHAPKEYYLQKWEKSKFKLLKYMYLNDISSSDREYYKYTGIKEV